MSPSFHLDAPAKINLGLRIVGRRDDGYHELDSLFAPLDRHGRAAHLVSQLKLAATSSWEGGLFVMIARRPE